MPITEVGLRFEEEVVHYVKDTVTSTDVFQRRKNGNWKSKEGNLISFEELKSRQFETPTLVQQEVYHTYRTRNYSRARAKRSDLRLVFPDGYDIMIECKHQDVGGSVDEKIWEGIPNRLAEGAFWTDQFALFLRGDHFEREAIDLLQNLYEKKFDGQVTVVSEYKSFINYQFNQHA